jgi:4-amino-4-deoxy-L-arabinose transferase-like glycosyltransferase
VKGRRQRVLVWSIPAITLLAFGLRLASLGRQSLWYDEAFSLAVAQADWPIFWAALLSDGAHPPGYYLLLRGGLALWGDSEFGVRFLSALSGTLVVPLMYRLGSILGGRRWGLGAGLLLALNPFALWYAQEARMYSLLLCLAIAGGYAFWRLVRRPNVRHWLLLSFVTALSFQVHYFALVLSLAQLVYLLLSLRRTYPALRWWAGAQAFACLAFLPWAAAIATREGRNFGIGWIHAPTPLDLPLTLSNLAFALSDPSSAWTWMGLALIVGAAATGAIVLFRELEPCTQLTPHSPLPTLHSLLPSSYSFLLAWLLVPLAFTWLLSLRLPVYVDRFLIICLPPLLLAGSTISLSSAWLARGTMIVLIVAGAGASARSWLDPALAKEDWRGAAAYVQSQDEPGDALIMRDLQNSIPFGYYYRGELSVQIASVNRETRSLDDLGRGYRRVWLVYRRPFAPTHSLAGSWPMSWRDEGDPVISGWLVSHETALAEETSFPGVYVLLYALPPDQSAAGEHD